MRTIARQKRHLETVNGKRTSMILRLKSMISNKGRRERLPFSENEEQEREKERA